MPYCPNPQCSHRLRTGRPPEFQPGQSTCADCGTTLVGQNPMPPEILPPLSSPLRIRLAWTLGTVVCLWLALLIPMPFLQQVSFFDGQQELTPTAVRFGPLSMGIVPFLFGFVMVELYALIVPALRRRRLSDPALRRKLWRASLSFGVAWCLARGLVAAWTLEGLEWNLAQLNQPPLVADPGWWFRVRFALTQTAGSCLFVLAAGLISRKGLGSGYAVVIVADACATLPGHLRAASFHWSTEQITTLTLLLGAGLLLLSAWALWRFFSLDRRRPWRLPLVAPTCGMLPLELAWSLCLIPPLLSNFFWLPWLEDLTANFYPGSTPHLIVEIALLLLFLPLASSWFYWRHRRGFRRADRREWWRGRGWSALLLAAMVVYGEVAWRLLGPLSLCLPAALTLVGVTAVASDLASELRFRRRLGCEPGVLAVHQDVSDALRAAAGAGSPVLIQGLRYRSLGYFFMPYVPLVLLARPGPGPGVALDNPPGTDLIVGSGVSRESGAAP
jgi:preprotein translocase subunit SecY